MDAPPGKPCQSPWMCHFLYMRLEAILSIFEGYEAILETLMRHWAHYGRKRAKGFLGFKVAIR